MKTNAACVLSIALALVGCKKPAPGGPGEPVPSAIASVSLSPSDATALEPALARLDWRVEARRGTASAPDGLLARHRAELEHHFGAPVPYPLAFQAAAIAPDRVAVLLQATAGEPRPLVWLLDAKGDIVWTKEHPMGGVKPGASEPVLLPAPDGHVCLAWCNGASESIALRRWAEDGGAFADYDALRVEGCDALSGLYWPHHGWVLAVARQGTAVLELIDENGGRAWGDDGLPLRWTWTTAAPVSLALDTEDSLMLFRLGESGGEGSAEYVFASRWSPDGRPMWPGPLSVKRLPSPVRDPKVRVVLEPAADGGIRATLPGTALAGSELVSVDVASDGTVTHR